MSVKAIPDGYHTITPYVVINDAGKCLEFLKKAFDAEEKSVIRMGDIICNAEMKIGDSMIMFADHTDNCPHPVRPANIYLYVDDTDATYQKAIDAGAKSVMEPADQFYGDRNAGVEDCCGNTWWIATHVEDVAPEEMEKRMQEQAKKKHG